LGFQTGFGQEAILTLGDRCVALGNTSGTRESSGAQSLSLRPTEDKFKLISKFGLRPNLLLGLLRAGDHTASAE
jgi:hypothetical protein